MKIAGFVIFDISFNDDSINIFQVFHYILYVLYYIISLIIVFTLNGIGLLNIILVIIIIKFGSFFLIFTSILFNHLLILNWIIWLIVFHFIILIVQVLLSLSHQSILLLYAYKLRIILLMLPILIKELRA